MASSTHGPITLGTQLPSREFALIGSGDASKVLELAIRLEADGAESLWIGESVVARPRFDAYTMLAAIAAVTSRAQLGTSVLLPALRSPVGFAHQVATIDQLSNGRLILGVGAGGPIPGTVIEFAAMQQDYKRRLTGLDATIAAARALWAGAADGTPVDDPTGRFGFEALSVFPPTTTPAGPPVWLATATPAGLERCGRLYDGWFPYPPDPAEFARMSELIDASALAAGRDPSAITRGLFVNVAIGDGADDRMDDYSRRYYGSNRAAIGSFQAMLTGSTDDVADRLAAYVQAGATHLAIRHASFELNQIADEAVALRTTLRSKL